MSVNEYFDAGKIKKRARGLRENMTGSERVLWNELRNRKLAGYKFLRQHPILYKGNLKRYNYFIADFYCYEKKTIIEVDGPVHNKTGEYDQFRDAELGDLGIRILRIKDRDLENMNEIKSRILAFLDTII